MYFPKISQNFSHFPIFSHISPFLVKYFSSSIYLKGGFAQLLKKTNFKTLIAIFLFEFKQS